MRRTKPKAGDLVRLRSGGPLMTAERVSDDVREAYARCSWFDARELPHAEYFKITALELVEPEETEPDRSG